MNDRHVVDPPAGWQTGAACASGDPDIWYPDSGAGDVATAAMSVCHTCPVVVECGNHGILHERHGIWGGMTPGQRKATRRQLRIRLEVPGAHYETPERAAA